MKRTTKSERLRIRTTPEHKRRLLALALLANQPGNLSAGLRYLLDRSSALVSREVNNAQ